MRFCMVPIIAPMFPPGEAIPGLSIMAPLPAMPPLPVLLGGTLHLPRKDHDPYDAVYASAAQLHSAGVTFAIRSQGGGPARFRDSDDPAKGRVA